MFEAWLCFESIIRNERRQEMKLIPRPYQHGALYGDHRGIGAFKCWEDHQSTLVQLPTGTGKTLVAAMAIKARSHGRALFACHLREILIPARKSLRAMTGFDVGLELAGVTSSTLNPEPVIVSSIQTLSSEGRLEQLSPYDFSLIIFDEVHRGLSPSWLRVADHFKQNPDCKILGLTATPSRHDKKKLKGIVESVAYQYSLKDAIDDGWLVRPHQRIQKVAGLDLSGISRAGKDLSKIELAAKMEEVAVLSAHRSLESIFSLYPHELDTIPQEGWADHIADRPAKRTLAFCASVLHSEMVATALNSFRPGLCAWAHGGTDRNDRRTIFQRFETGETPVFANCGLTIEGYDNPYIELILDMAPTLSKERFIQKTGRGTRTLPGVIDGLETAEERKEAIRQSRKPVVVIIDFTGNSGKHKLISLIDVFGEDLSDKVKAELKIRAEKEPIDVEKEAEVIVAEEARILQLKKTQFEETVVNGFTGKRKKVKSKKEKSNKPRVLSPEQLTYLAKQKLKPETRTMEENVHLWKQSVYRKKAGLCSYGQAYVLRRYGYSKEALRVMQWGVANKIFDQLKANGWKQQ